MSKRTKFQVRSDAAKQRWHVRDDQKEGFWRQHLEAWQKSGLSKRGYCMENDLAYSSFMTWRREIELRDREKVPPANVAELLAKTPGRNANPFVPIRIVPERESQEVKQVSEAKDGVAQQIEIVLPSGAVIRVHDSCDPCFVAKLLSGLEK